jgi:hypothetical protein
MQIGGEVEVRVGAGTEEETIEGTMLLQPETTGVEIEGGAAAAAAAETETEAEESEAEAAPAQPELESGSGGVVCMIDTTLI